MTEKQKRPRFKEVLKDLGETSSLHAVPKIVSSRQIAVKVLWGLLLCGATGLFCYQFIELLQEYLSYPIKTTVSLQFDSLQFPAITVCNVNPLKKVIFEDQMTSEIEQLLDEIDKLNYIQSESNSSMVLNFENDTFETFGFLEDTGITRTQYDKWRADVYAKFDALPMETKKRMGHQLKDFVKSWTFSGGETSPKEMFKVIPNTLYGNCFTMYKSPTAVTSGQDNGITMVLNLEIFNYYEQLTLSYGAKLLIHQGHTYPLPDREGYILNPGFETNIGLKLRSVHHLGGQYGECFDKEYKYMVNGNIYDYSVSLCHSSCDAEYILKVCGCVPIEAPIKISEQVCNSKDFSCIYTARSKFAEALKQCHCHKRCEDDIYIASISGRSWPVKDYFERVLMTDICKADKSEDFMNECEEFKHKNLTYESYKKASQNFLKVNIFFEDLNYEDILEEPMYPTIRFVSDVGGALGLFMGASLLTFVEILQLILEIVLFLKGNTKTSPDNPQIIKTKVQQLQ